MKHLKQWFFKITKYADELLKGHKNLDWPQKTIAMQKNWIGKSHGTEIYFNIGGKKWPIFTTRPDTIFGVTFMVVSAQHPKLMELVTKKQKKEVESFLKKLKSVSQKSIKELEELDKEGVFTGSYAINPVNSEKVPVYAGNFVVADYGSGMVMAVPAHDQRDFLFAKKYNIPIRIVIQPEDGEINAGKMSRAYTGDGELVSSGEFNGWNNRNAIDAITDWLKNKGIGKKVVNYKLRDWCLSRQRYWGTPIPIIYCNNCGTVPVPEKDLPVELPEKVNFGEGNPLLTNNSWINVKCPKCGKDAKRETDTMDTFVNSSWYFLRYCDPKNDKEIFSKQKAKYWMPIDLYIGGAEHSCMHLIYHRFYTMFLHDLKLIDFKEPTPRLFHQGMINAENGEKMSKSKGNVIEPLETIAKYGADTTRFFLMSVASPDKGFNWSEAGINGSLKFIKRIISFYKNVKIGKTSEELENKLHKTIKQVSKEIENVYGYRDATIRLRELFNEMEKEKSVGKDALEIFLKLLHPFCPHITEELWEKIGGRGFVSLAKWPEADEKKLRQKKVTKEDLNEKIIQKLAPLVEKFSEKEKIYIYAIPFEIKEINAEKISKAVGKKVEVYATNDSSKYDPENKSKKARSGMPGIYLE